MIQKRFFNLSKYFKEDEIPDVIDYIENVLMEKVYNNQLLGVMEDSLDGTSIDLSFKNISHVIKRLEVKGHFIYIEYKILLETEWGKIAKSLIDEDFYLTIKPRLIRTPGNKIVSLFFDLGSGDKQEFRENQIDILLG